MSSTLTRREAANEGFDLFAGRSPSEQRCQLQKRFRPNVSNWVGLLEKKKRSKFAIKNSWDEISRFASLIDWGKLWRQTVAKMTILIYKWKCACWERLRSRFQWYTVAFLLVSPGSATVPYKGQNLPGFSATFPPFLPSSNSEANSEL